jgi:RNA polymerase sigma factor (sigma-70 family)
MRNTQIEAFYKENFNRLIKRVGHRAGTHWAAEDVVQEAFVRALKYWDTYDPANKEIGAWFNTILNNALRDYTRDERRYGMCEEFEDEKHNDLALSPEALGAAAKIRELIAAKGQPTKSILTMYYLQGYKPKEIVEVLDVEVKTVRQYVWRFRDELKEKL